MCIWGQERNDLVSRDPRGSISSAVSRLSGPGESPLSRCTQGITRLMVSSSSALAHTTTSAVTTAAAAPGEVSEAASPLLGLSRVRD